MIEKDETTFHFKEEEDQYVFHIMHKVIPSEDFNVHILLRTLNEAMQKKNRAAIDLLINSLYHFKDGRIELIDFYLP